VSESISLFLISQKSRNTLVSSKTCKDFLYWNNVANFSAENKKNVEIKIMGIDRK